jgi:hypothetical protein
MSQKSHVKQKVEPTNPSDLLINDQQTTITANIETHSSRYNLRSRDSQQASAFYKPIPENHKSNKLAILEPREPSGLSITAYSSPRRALTPPIDNNNRVISPIRISTPPSLKYNSLIQAWSADRLKSSFGNFRKVNTDPAVRRPVADDYIPLPDHITTPARAL